MTPQQRRELQRLIDEARYAMLESGLHAESQTRSEAAQERATETYMAVVSYLDEITDYSTAGAVSGP